MLRPVFILALLCLLVIYWRQPSSSSSPSSSSDSSSEDPLSRPKAAQPGHSQKSFSSSRTSQVSKRTVAVGDLHSDLPQTLAVLSLAKVIDADGNWSGGQDTLVQTGDIVDRGPDTIAIYNLFDKLRKQAHDAGGKDYASFGGRQKRKEAWDVRTGWLGKMIYNNFNITHVRANTVFSHGDMEPEWARLGVDTLNFLAQEAIWESNYRPIWSRAQATQEDGAKATCERVEEVKKALGVHRLISGHTPQYRTGKILSLCNGGYMVIDVGISNYYGGHLAALEIIENGDGTENVYALYPGGKRLL
ncbi:hypothetical protein BGZ58_008207 [Dissophora ornata]|nr:hypothetical protein BGZ58_008207 [Dissophora ornata]